MKQQGGDARRALKNPDKQAKQVTSAVKRVGKPEVNFGALVIDWGIRLTRWLGYILLFVALAVIIINIITLVTGSGASLNSLLGSKVNIIGDQSEVVATNGYGGNWFWPMLDKMYPGFSVFIKIGLFIIPVALVYLLLKFCAYVARNFLELVANMSGREPAQISLLVCLFAWAVAIILLWAVLGDDIAMGYLLAGVAGLAINLGLFALSNILRQVKLSSSIKPVVRDSSPSSE